MTAAAAVALSMAVVVPGAGALRVHAGQVAHAGQHLSQGARPGHVDGNPHRTQIGEGSLAHPVAQDGVHLPLAQALRGAAPLQVARQELDGLAGGVDHGQVPGPAEVGRYQAVEAVLVGRRDADLHLLEPPF